MPRTYNYSSKSHNRRRGFKKRGKIYGAAAYQLYKDVRYLKSLVNVEFKYDDTTVSGGNVDNNGTVTYISGIQQGDAGTQRDGNQVKVVSLQLRGEVSQNPSATDTTLRTMIVCDTKPRSGVGISITDVLDTINVNSFRNLNNRKRFWIMYDRNTYLSINGSRTRKIPAWYKKLQMKLVFDGAANNDSTSYSIYLIQISDEATNTPVVDWRTRLRFIDN